MKKLAYYRITIKNISGSSPADGFIDPQSANDYMTFNKISYALENWPTDINSSLAKARANIRWNIVKEQLGLVLNPISVFDVIAPGANINTPPTSVSFTVVYERPDYLNIPDELNAGHFLKDADAISRFVCRALTSSRTINTTVLNPTEKYFDTLSVEVGALVKDLATAKSSVTVEQIQYTDN